jgi:hypothetical protein
MSSLKLPVGCRGGCITVAKYSFKTEQKSYLTEVAVDDWVINSIEERMRANQKWRVVSFCGILLILGLLPYAAGQYYFYTHVYTIGVYDIYIINFIPYITFYVPLWIWARSGRESTMIKRLLACIDKMNDDLLKSPAISKERQRLAKLIFRCSRKMRSYRVLLPHRTDQRIRNEQVLRASFAIRQPMRLVMLGNAEDLNFVKANLARAVIRIGTGNWTQVGDLAGEVTKSIRTQARYASLLPILGFVVPILTAIIAGLLKSK